MTILVFLSHPAQFLFYKNPVQRLRDKGHHVFVVIITKDVLKELLEEAAAGILPGQHIEYITSIFKRNSNRWLPPDLNKKVYVKKAMTLGLRKHQYKSSSGSKQIKYKYEVDKLRYELQRMLYDASQNQEQNFQKI